MKQTKTNGETYSIHSNPRALESAPAETLLDLFETLQREFYGTKDDLATEADICRNLSDSFLYSHCLAEQLSLIIEVLAENRGRARQLIRDAHVRCLEKYYEFRDTGDSTPNYIEIPPRPGLEKGGQHGS